jgi:NADH-quinone oxidoreductase subunit L
MSGLIVALPLLPLLGSLLLMVMADRVPARVAALTACGTVALAAAGVLLLAGLWFSSPPGAGQWSVSLGPWFSVPGFSAVAALRLDPLSLVMAFVVTFIGFFIHLYSVEYMAGEEGYARYFAWLDLFVAAMLLLVLADDLLLLYAGWEGVGLCSYLLIGFRYREAHNGYAARKAFVMTRAGDVLLLLGLLFLAARFHTLRIDAVVAAARGVWLPGAAAATAVTLLLLGGALGKSAQAPLHTWLPDAMAGPTPVSALIHAASMVTAGVYLIARLHGLFDLAPVTMDLIALIGAVTLLLAGFSALVQEDIKRVLAFSTISQVGYMFLALGLGAWSAAIFHLFTHAFFKALLFLAAGAVILAADHEQRLGRVGGLRRRMPLVFGAFLAGGASLAALPLVTAGFFSKEVIITAAWRVPALWVASLIGAVVTAAYVSRLIARLFFISPELEPAHRPGWAMAVPLAVLAFGAIAAGFMEWPEWVGDVHLFSVWLAPLFGMPEGSMPARAAFAAFAAPFVGLLFWWGGRELAMRPWALRAGDLWREGWGFDRFYARMIERPWNDLARASAGERFDRLYDSVERFMAWTWAVLSDLQSGQVRRYLAGLVIGVLLLLAVAL